MVFRPYANDDGEIYSYTVIAVDLFRVLKQPCGFRMTKLVLELEFG